jgi:hypothetical protein
VSAVSGASENVHYYSPAENLKHTIGGNSFEGLTLRWVVFGQCKPSAWNCRSGAEQDALRVLLKNNAWALLGENGLRAKTMHGELTAAQNLAHHATFATTRAKNDAEQFNARNLESEVTEARERFTRLRETNREIYTRMEIENADAIALVGKDGDFSGVSNWLYRFSLSKNWNDAAVYFHGTSDTYSHLVRSPNYSAVRDGETLRVSSGILVPFSVSAVLSWLRGDSPAPRTQYGALERVELARPDGAAWIAVKCGCHYIDGAKDFGGEFAELLRPAHTVTLVKGTPELRWGEETKTEFLARLREKSTRWLATLAETQRGEERRSLGFVEAAVKTRDNRQTALAELQSVVAKCESEQATAEQQAAAVKARLVGTDLETVNGAVKSALVALGTLGL